jgi:hypothetical protein
MLDTTCSVPDAESRGRECAAPTNSKQVTSVSSSPAREYLVDQLVIAASHLAETHIFRKDPELPLCRDCMMSGLNGRPIQHLSSCPVGLVLGAIGELLREPPSRSQWDSDQDMKVGKWLRALTGFLPGYSPEIDRLLEELR